MVISSTGPTHHTVLGVPVPSVFPSRKKKRTMEERAKIVSFFNHVDFFFTFKKKI